MYFRHSWAANSVVCDLIWPKIELFQDIMHFPVIRKLKKDRINSNREKEETLIVLDVQGQLTPLSVVISAAEILIQDFMYDLITCKKKNPIKNEDARVAKTLYIYIYTYYIYDFQTYKGS